MYRFSELIFDTYDSKLFELYQRMDNLDWVWEQLYLVNLKELENVEKSTIKELQNKAQRGMQIANISDKKELSQKWVNYMFSRETEALFIYLYSLRENFLKEHLVIENKKIFKKIQRENVIFVSPHWGAFYSLPLILSALDFEVYPVANGDESDHLERIFDTLEKPHKKNVNVILSTKYPVRLLKEMNYYLKNGKNILVYPEYTFGKEPKYDATYLGIKFPTARGVASISQSQRVNIQPVSLRRIPGTSKFELKFYDTISTKKDVISINKTLHSTIDKIVRQDLSQWWYWEIFEKNMR